MPVIDATFYPLIVTERPTELFRQPPAGTDMGAARLCPITEVRPGDWVLGEFECPMNPDRLDTLMQSVACFPALPATLNGYVALDGQSPVWHNDETALIIPREYIPGETYADRSSGYRVGDRVERTFIYDPIHDDARDTVGKARPVIQRGTVTDVDDGALSIAWSGYWVNGHKEEQAMRLANPEDIARERAVFGFAVGDTVTVEGSYATGVVLELYYHPWAGAPCARVFWPGSPWDNYCSYDFSPTTHYVHKIPENTYSITSRETRTAAA
ncbi:hypothetical protein [Streptomyces silvensis]|uniref:Uncharacterized protein n=1 Tax=Streptomyces silvensis TaxID=1765722 RepID=A0A0W7X3Z6_9ACTN|nr:hypothetical protein [Streptomyces silvensis]KUF17418.1 hypothetical protein AT728_16605 [Streptomyces silvensis]